jgi:hypothetical protein
VSKCFVELARCPRKRARICLSVQESMTAFARTRRGNSTEPSSDRSLKLAKASCRFLARWFGDRKSKAQPRLSRGAERQGRRTRLPFCDCYSELMLERNSPFDLVLLSLSMSNSIASTGDSGFRTLRRTQIRERSSLGISNSSLRVPER